MQNNGPDDKSPNNKLEDDLEQLGQAYQRLAPEEPPGLLDQAILNSAHRAVGKKAGWMDFGWIHGLTTAAVVVLALTIILTQRQVVLPEETIRQLNGPAKAMVAKQAAATPADEIAAAAPAPALTGAVRPDAARAVADRIEAERSQLSAEELRLQAILQLKRDGNDSWKTELESFVESYPDYPLPDELKN